MKNEIVWDLKKKMENGKLWKGLDGVGWGYLCLLEDNWQKEEEWEEEEEEDEEEDEKDEEEEDEEK